LRAALEGSLRRLRVDAIDLYQFHRPDPKVPFEESLGALINMRNEGKIRAIGVSNVTLAQLQLANEMTEIVSVQNRYNIGDRRSEDVLDFCTRTGIVFLPWAPVAAGQVHAESPQVVELARRKGVTPAQLALAWLLHRSPMMLPIPGTSKVAHLEENVAAAAIKLDREEASTMAA
jgi:aryl-alcohol dehydrogenase-like predicted oxidoreductase